MSYLDPSQHDSAEHGGHPRVPGADHHAVTSRRLRVTALVAAMLWLTSCRLDATVSLVMDEDGTGTVTVTATADAELVAKVPDLAEELELGDAVAAGWDVTGPEPTEEGGLTITLRHPFRDADEATSLLSSLGGPFASMAVTRIIEGTGVEASATNSLGGTFVLRRGWAGFADQQLIEAVGGTPFADRIGDATPEESVVGNVRGDVARSRHDVERRARTTARSDGTYRSTVRSRRSNCRPCRSRRRATTGLGR